MRTDLIHLTTIQTGVFARPGPSGNIIYLQVRHFAENGDLSSELHPDIYSEDINSRHVLAEGDILFAAKGAKNFASVFTSKKPAVASTSFFILRISNSWKGKILPHFLAWYLNQSSVISDLKMQAIGSAMPSISKGVLQSIEVSVPNLTAQKKILKISELRKREKELKSRIETLRDKIIEQTILKTLK
ncbi:hypothetical protein SDC9_66725 [bioreactor metagenome]|uniref:Type I restriction modification DNA specificity domain-containing protein n=1 Tax=bioreactor metagenome TaxID=1076179 RepID=A0A644XVQ4_9ZZZZ